MDNIALFAGGGYLLGIVLFFIFERMGWLYKWSGLKDPRSKSVEPDQDPKEKSP